VTIASPHKTEDPALADWVARYQKRFGVAPSDYAVTAYGAAQIIIDSIKRVAESGKDVNRSNVRDAIQAANVNTLQGEVSFDKNGDMISKVISVFQVTHDPNHPEDDVIHQYKYIGVAPESPVG
jgi:branched-chain amino acid transport system substrate-binding protein